MTGSSILPATIHNGKIYFLFGKENDLENSAKGFSDFGGGIEEGETAYNTAMREGGEELTGFLGDDKAIRQMIRKNGGTYHIFHNHHYHVHIFFMEYDPKLPEYYNKNHRFLWDRMDKYYLKKTKLFEKIEIKWFSVNEMRERKKEFRNFYQEIVDTLYKELPKIKTFLNKCRHRSSRKNNKTILKQKQKQKQNKTKKNRQNTTKIL